MQTAERLVFFLVLFSLYNKGIAPTLIGAIFLFIDFEKVALKKHLFAVIFRQYRRNRILRSA